MNNYERLTSKLQKLETKYLDAGQDLGAYLDSLLQQRYLTYWDYIHLDTLLSLQVPRTHFPDEEVFIMYHQISELYFKLILHEQKQLVADTTNDTAFFAEKINRINQYYKALISSFSIMVRGLNRDQFLQFRMALLPSSGFQSAQFRMIELYATPLDLLVHPTERDKITHKEDIETLYERVYWKKGATDKVTGEKTLTLKEFERRYSPRFIRMAKELQGQTIYHKYLALPAEAKEHKTLKYELRKFDLNANVNWPLMHLGSAYRYLSKEKETIDATGGTNWKSYLPPDFQQIVFFPEVHDSEELANWGKQWVDHLLNPEKPV
ncbi:tryptophan 2,3-dioxygenase family protein [Robiginitalea sp.]|nr:tryptophan 2,3-dioxygenase family protein [Robiginitalea sp.]